MNYTLNYDEPIPEVVERLKMEHKEIQTRLPISTKPVRKEI